MSQRSGRKAFTLIELVIAMGTGGMVMLLAIGMVHQAMLHSALVRRETEHLRTLDRLASDFRRDAHQSVDYTVAGPTEVRFQLIGGQQVLYRATESSVVRVEDQGRQGARRELFAMPSPHRVEFAQVEEPTRALLTISVTPGTTGRTRIERSVAATIATRSKLQAFTPAQSEDQQ